jgi:hypothetical protein
MPIRKKQDPSDPILIYGVKVDPAKHPALHQKLLSLGLGRPRLDFIRDQLEALLQGNLPAGVGEGVAAPSVAAGIKRPDPTPTPAAPQAAPLKIASPAAEPEESAAELARRQEEARKLAGKFGDM